MSFTSPLFPFFLFATFLIWLPAGHSGRKAVLLSSSLIFYGLWSPWFLLALAYVWSVVHFVPPRIAGAANPHVRKRWLAVGVLALVATLVLLKYASAVAPASRIPVLVLPVGLSFYVFQSISYLVDTHRRLLVHSRSLLDTGLFVSFFPLLLAGPIERGRRWLPQIETFHAFRASNLLAGGESIALGYFLKVGIADPVAGFVNDVFGRVSSSYPGELAAGLLLYSLQILTDFSGYSLIARGVARLFGYKVQPNFEQPYFSRSFSEFWRRWHLSLSAWLQEYVFTPLFQGLLRKVESAKIAADSRAMYVAYGVAAIATMLLAGAWHGVGMTFILWGLLHGVALAFERVFVFGNKPIRKRARLKGPRGVITSGLAMATVFGLVSLAWVPFRSDSIGATLQYYRGLVGHDWSVPLPMLRAVVLGYAGLLAVEFTQYRRGDEFVFRAAPRWLRPALFGGLLVHTLLYAGRAGTAPFVYAQF